jgi:hypothetical protein
MIKFTTPDLDGYGFDLTADRVVRFNKHPDGTYLNTRATYSINKKQFTHYELRQHALGRSTPLVVVEQKKPRNKWVIFAWVVLIGFIVVGSVTECSFTVNKYH